MAQFNDEMDLVGVTQDHRWKLGASVSITWRFRDAASAAIDVSSRVFTLGLWDNTNSQVSLTFTADMSDAANGNVVMSLDDTSSLDIANDYSIEAWYTEGAKKVFLYEGAVTLEEPKLLPS